MERLVSDAAAGAGKVHGEGEGDPVGNKEMVMTRPEI